MHSEKTRLTNFQKRVIEAVLTIPFGQTRSYKWVAQRIGCPSGARAVGNALNKNTLAPFVPCHRVISSDGTLGGYRFGSKKKSVLLKQEKRGYL